VLGASTSSSRDSVGDLLVRGSAASSNASMGSMGSVGSVLSAGSGLTPCPPRKQRDSRLGAAAPPPAVQRIRRRQRQQGAAKEAKKRALAVARWARLRAAVALLRSLIQVRQRKSPKLQRPRIKSPDGPNKFSNVRSSIESLISCGKAKPVISVAELRQDAVPYSQQVNMEYYTDEALVLRSKLREDPQVLAALDKWWQTLPKSPFGGVSKQTYSGLSLCLNKALNRQYKYLEALGSAEQDWAEDSRGRQEMKSDLLSDAMFQLADLWCEGMAAEGYAKFLEQLLEAVTLNRDGIKTLRPLARVQCMDKPVCKISTLRKATQKLWASTAAGRLIKAASPKSKRSSPKNALALSCPDLKQTISRMTENNPGRTVVRESRSAMHGSDKRGLQPNDLCQDTFASILPDIEAARAGRGAEGYTTSNSGGWESSVPQLPCVAGKSKGHKGGIQLVAKGAKIHKRNRFRDLPVSRMPSSPSKPKTKSMEWAELVAQHRKEEDMREAVYAMDTLHNTPVLNFHVVNTPKHMQSPGGNNLRQSMDF